MQMKLKFLLPAAMLFGFVHVTVLAQENSQPDGNTKESTYHTETNSTDDKNLIIDFDARPPKIQSAQKETQTPAPNKKEETTKAEKKTTENDDPLSFNFLYLIIQKFKISDIVENGSE
jgi:hypothetical protein